MKIAVFKCIIASIAVLLCVDAYFLHITNWALKDRLDYRIGMRQDWIKWEKGGVLPAKITQSFAALNEAEIVIFRKALNINQASLSITVSCAFLALVALLLCYRLPK